MKFKKKTKLFRNKKKEEIWTLPHEMNLTARSTKVWWWLLYSTKQNDACLNKFSQHGALGWMYRGAVSLILQKKLHMKTHRARSGNGLLAAFYFRLFITIEEIHVVCMFSFFLLPQFFGGDSFIISLCWAGSVLNNKTRWKITQEERKEKAERTNKRLIYNKWY